MISCTVLSIHTCLIFRLSCFMEFFQSGHLIIFMKKVSQSYSMTSKISVFFAKTEEVAMKYGSLYILCFCIR